MDQKLTYFLVGTVVSLFCILAVHRLAVWRNNRNAIRKYVEEYKATFAEHLGDLANGTELMGTHSKFFKDYKFAVDKIRPHLPKGHQRKLQKAWEEYTGKDNGLAFTPEEWVMTMGGGGTDKIFRDFDKAFNNLCTCLDDLL